MRDLVFLLVLAIAAACMVVGVSHWSVAAAWIVAGVLLALIAWLGLGGADEPGDPGDDE